MYVVRLKDGEFTRNPSHLLGHNILLKFMLIGQLAGEEIREVIENAYNEVVQWNSNLFKVPSGKAGRDFLEEMVKTINLFNCGNNLASVAITMLMIMPPLLLQKPAKSSKAKDHRMYLEKRLKLWTEGKISELVREGKVIQKRLSMNKKKKTDTQQIFVRLMLQGKVSAALRWIGTNRSTRMEVDKEVLQTLQQKHPIAARLSENAKIKGPLQKVEDVLYENIDGKAIHLAAKRTQGSAGPTGMNSEGWARILCTKQLKSKPDELCDAIATFARKLCKEYVNPCHLHAYTACRLIPLDKNPGVRPVGVGEVLRRIVGKAVTASLKQELIDATCPIQVCAGVKGGIEAAIHALRQIYDDPETDGILLVDADNAFNSLNRNAALHNVQYTCPEFQKYLINTYREPAELYIAGTSKVISSCEGTTQGDNAAMGFYSCSLMPLVNVLKVHQACRDQPQKELPKQVLYADDAAAGGTLSQLHSWWSDICREGPCLGYFPKPSKTVLVVKKEKEVEAKRLFPNVKITTRGSRYLGSFIGTREGLDDFLQKQTMEWSKDVKALAEIAKFEPQVSYAAFIYGTSKRWNFVSRTTPNISENMKQLDWIIQETFLPAILGKDHITDEMKKIAALQPKRGGLGIGGVSKACDLEYLNSKLMTQNLAEHIYNQESVYKEDWTKTEKSVKTVLENKQQFHDQNRADLYNNLSVKEQRIIDLASEKGASSWLTSLPLESCGFTLNKQEFHDAMLLRYDFRIKDIASVCACGDKNNVNHTLICKKGGFVSLRHNNLRYVTADILRSHSICKDVQVEPVLLPVTGEHLTAGTVTGEARLDVSARNFWSPLRNTII